MSSSNKIPAVHPVSGRQNGWRFELIDLTRPINEESAYALWGDLAAGEENRWTRDISVEVKSDYSSANAMSCQISLPDHISTHMDAPIHTLPGGAYLHQVDISRMIGEAVVVDLGKGPGDYAITPEDLENATPKIEPGDIVLIYSEYVDADEKTRVRQSYLTPEAARWLVQREVKSVGVESLGIEHIPDGYLVHHWPKKDTHNPPSWPAHRILFENNIYAIEGLTNLRLIRGERVKFSALPLLFPGLTGCPVRAVAWRDIE